MPTEGMWNELRHRLLAHGSWLYDEGEDRFGFDLTTFFDPFAPEFKSMPTQRKMLILQELFYCAIDPILLSLTYKMFCREYNHEELYNDFGHALLEVLKSVSADDLVTIDIHNPQNWYRGEKDNPLSESAHEATVMVLDGMHADFQERLIQQEDPLIRQRMVYTQRTNILIRPNDDPILDQIGEELLRRVETFEPDVKVRYGDVRLLASDIHDELDPENKRKRLGLAQLLYESIESLDLETLKKLPMFEGERVEHFVDTKKDPKKWLYSRVTDLALRRNLCQIRGVEFIK